MYEIKIIFIWLHLEELKCMLIADTLLFSVSAVYEELCVQIRCLKLWLPDNVYDLGERSVETCDNDAEGGS